MSGGPSMAARVLAEIDRDPTQIAREIAATVGCSKAYVSQTAQRNDRQFGRVYSKGLPTNTRLSEANLRWVAGQCRKHRISFEDFINACVTDARLDDTETENKL